MIDVAEFKGAVGWLQRCMAELAQNPANKNLRDGVTLSFEVTYNIAERVLRQALSLTFTDPSPSHLSSRELMRIAAEEGLSIATGEMWLRYGIALERMYETLGDSFSQDVLPLLPQYLSELQEFVPRLEARLVQLA